jgi:hypothetical protein
MNCMDEYISVIPSFNSPAFSFFNTNSTSEGPNASPFSARLCARPNPPRVLRPISSLPLRTTLLLLFHPSPIPPITTCWCSLSVVLEGPPQPPSTCSSVTQSPPLGSINEAPFPHSLVHCPPILPPSHLFHSVSRVSDEFQPFSLSLSYSMSALPDPL